MASIESDYTLQLIDHFYDKNITSFILVTPFYKMGSFDLIMNNKEQKIWSLD
jgi:hypothetical protein